MRTLNVLYQTNNNYAVVTGISMTSLFENNKDIEEINVFVLDDEISKENKDKMLALCSAYNRQITFVDTQIILKRLLELKVAPYRNTYTTYFKLMAIKDLPVPDERILMIDGDTIINGSLSELVDMDISDSLCAATCDCLMNKYKALVDIPLTDKYYNCGVLLINQKMWKSEHCEERIADHLKNVRNGYFTVDQDIINVLFRSRIQNLDMKYNFNSGFYIYGIAESLKMYDLKEPYYYSEDVIKKAYANPTIYHCMGAMTGRPWEKDSIHPQNGIFDRYVAISPWKNFEKAAVKRDKIFTVQRKLYQILPRRLYIPLHKAALNRFLKNMNKTVQAKK